MSTLDHNLEQSGENLAPIAGRQAERGAVDAALDALVCAEGALESQSALEDCCAAVTLFGEAGTGKSRLCAYAMGHAAARHLRFLSGSGFDTERNTPFVPWRSVIRNLFNLTSEHAHAEYQPFVEAQVKEEHKELVPLLAAVFPEAIRHSETTEKARDIN